MRMLHAADIAFARYRLAPYLRPTPLEAAPGLGDSIWLKLENLNRTRSFKARGALNALLALDQRAKARGIIAASSGNHAQGVAYAARLLGVQARILMPLHTPKRKIEGVRRYGANAVLYGATYDEAEAEARRLAQAENLTYLSPYNDPLVVAGGGTVGLEILDELPDLARVIVPAGGGGLISGIGLALKAQDPTIEVVGVCAEAAPALYNVVHRAQRPQIWNTLAEALSGEIEAGSITIEMAQQVVDRVLLVSEDALAEAIRWLLFRQGWVVEGGGAAGVAAILAGLLPDDHRQTAVIISGGNLDEETLHAVLQR